MGKNVIQKIDKMYILMNFKHFRETNLKSRQCEDDTNAMGNNEQELSDFNGKIQCEPPNNNLSR